MKYFVLVSMILIGCGEDDHDSVTQAVAAVQESLETQQQNGCRPEGNSDVAPIDKRDFKPVCE